MTHIEMVRTVRGKPGAKIDDAIREARAFAMQHRGETLLLFNRAVLRLTRYDDGSWPTEDELQAEFDKQA